MAGLAGMRALVTGADGFIGSHLVERLVEEGVHVKALCLYNSNGSYGWLNDYTQNHENKVDFHLGDVRDPGYVQNLADGVDAIFHLAALISIPYSYQAPASFVATNVQGTLNVLEAARQAGAVRVINTSTSEVYGTPETTPIREQHPLQAQSPYAATKVAADQLCYSYACSFGVDVVTLRPFNTFGPRQSTRAVIPAILTQLLAGRNEVHLGSLTPRRDFTYVSDTVDGFVRMASSQVPAGSVIQLGTGQAVTIQEIFDKCCEVTGVHARVTVEESRIRPAKGEVQVLESDPSRAYRNLQWKPTMSLIDGLKRTADWLESKQLPYVERYHR
ncbi:SDR family NAD(P)-dependent oxidoreductase [Amycolatopsis acidiphila]|nr:SDR family NAD(P)-dependent oxidoreductase [Amycolatopsis acidiphila]UIJ60413.1 SDR family NAD(P)-dependent oxidoreductase [Amycolatopsis acidiphila]